MNKRAKLIQLVHIGAGKLFKDEEQRRAWQLEHGGHRSCRDMSDDQLQHCVDVLKQMKVLTTRPPKKAGRVPFNPSPYMSKIEAMLAEMNLSWQYAESIAYRMTGGKGKGKTGKPGMQRLEWVKKREHFEGIINALEKEQHKRRYLEAIELNLEALELTEAYVNELLIANDCYSEKWKRDITTLKSVAEHLYQKYLNQQEQQHADS